MRKTALVLFCGLIAAPAAAATLTGKDAYGDWKSDAPGVTRKITPADLPPAGAALTFALSQQVPRPAGADRRRRSGPSHGVAAVRFRWAACCNDSERMRPRTKRRIQFCPYVIPRS